MAQKKIGEILVENSLISPSQLEEALELQKIFPGQTLGQLLCRLGFLNESDLVYILEQKGKRQKLADVLLKNSMVEPEKLAHAQEMAKKETVPLRKALLKLHYLDEETLARATAIQHDLPFVHLNNLQIDPEVIKAVTASYAQKQKFVPVSKIGSTLTLAMTQPLKLQELKELESSIRLKIISVIAPESEILLAQQKLYKVVPSQQAHEEMDLDVPDSIVDILTEASDEPDIDEEVKKVTERDSVIVKLVNKIIYDAYLNRASDIHIEPYPGKTDVIVRTRVDGKCKVYQRIPYKYKYAIPSRIKIMAELDIAERRKPQDGKINFKKFGPVDLELRVATMPTAGQLEDVVIRLLNTGEPVPFAKLGLTERNLDIFEDAIRKPHGLVLVVGPTGSGKTTTLHSAVAKINTPDIKIWTAEDPVEITQKGLRQVQVNPRIGLTFAKALRSFLRLDPDVILVGEMRDEETALIAVEASLTGHLVFSTLHTNSAPETVTRLLEMGLDPYAFADSLQCVIAQRLVRTLCEDCREMYTPSDAELQDIIDEYGSDVVADLGIKREEIAFSRARGCSRCMSTGYRGRIGIHEVLACTDTMKGMVKKKADTEVIRNQAMADGMTTLKQDGILKVFKGLTDIQEVRRVCLR